MNPPVLHRDLKPPNVLIDAGGVAKVSDFGLAQAVGSTTRLATGAGDLACQSPESLAGTCSPSSDVYSIGLILYEMLTGEHPFRNLLKQSSSGDRDEKVAQAHQKAREKPIRDAVGCNDELRFHPDLCEIVNRCLSYHPSDRYHSAVELLSDLESVGQVKSGASWAGPRTVQPTETCELLLQQARTAERRGDHEVALSFLERLIKQADTNKERIFLGEAFCLSGKIKAAQGNYTAARKEFYSAHNEYGNSLAGKLMLDLQRQLRGAKK
jgi:serine/threonine protein kinase